MGSTGPKRAKEADKIKDFVSWFEIPAIDFEQALAFYNHIYGFSMERATSQGYQMAFFPADSGIGGAIVAGPGSVPGDAGPLLYLNAGDDLAKVLGRVEEAGGKILMPKTKISGEAGFFALFIDSQGNKLALHSKH